MRRTELLARLHVTLGPTLVVGRVPGGTRRVIPITGGTVEGPRLRGVVLPGGADWNLARDDGTGTVSARYLLRTTDGVLVGVRNEGSWTADGFTTTPVLEAPEGGSAWLNGLALAGSLTPADGAVDLEFFVVEDDGGLPDATTRGSGAGPGRRPDGP